MLKTTSVGSSKKEVSKASLIRPGSNAKKIKMKANNKDKRKLVVKNKLGTAIQQETSRVSTVKVAVKRNSKGVPSKFS